MGTVRQPELVKLIVGLLARERRLLGQAAVRLTQAFGEVDAQSHPVAFTHTAYYAHELGEKPWRQFLAFSRLIDPGDLATVKLQTNDMEQEWAEDLRRPLNLDPGYISLSKLVLASTKNHWHRIYLGRGIYAEATLPFRDGAFRPQEWTYPDYRTPEHLAFFTDVRERYHRQLRSAAPA